ncbi:hypothetical protein CBM2599_A110021 [Cupriavidus taiwanensis]|nr:hypothetical protein CBM2599_A110021 [Cupriavidus taiwanensis]SOY81389.1 hypothetical protein CBM2600_A120007 [Cupriavidus taiwanensis]
MQIAPIDWHSRRNAGRIRTVAAAIAHRDLPHHDHRPDTPTPTLRPTGDPADPAPQGRLAPAGPWPGQRLKGRAWRCRC